MGRIFEHWRIPVAVIFSVVIIVGAYILARGIESPPVAQASAETALLQAIAVKDSDNDGLPDWEEALYGTDSQNLDSLGLGMTDGEAVAKGLVVPKAIADISVATSSSVSLDPSVPSAAAEGSITDTFAKNFFILYVATKQANGGEALSQDQISTLVEQLMDQLNSTVLPAPDFKSKEDIKVSVSDEYSLRAYAEQVGNIFKAQDISLPKSELQYLQDFVQDDDLSALDNINKIATAYRTSSAGLSALTVPEDLADTHLLLVNAMARLGEEISDFARVNTDPIATMLALQQYSNTVEALSKSFADIGSIYASKQIVMPTADQGTSQEKP